MLVLFRGHSEFTEVPDNPTAPINPGPATIFRGQTTTDTASDHANSGSATVTMLDTGSTPPMLSVTHADATAAPVQPGSVPSAVTDIQAPAMTRGDGGGLANGDGGGVARDGDALASLALNGWDYADHGWFIVPSTTNEYGDSSASGQAYAVAGDFTFDVAAGQFSADWFVA